MHLHLKKIAIYVREWSAIPFFLNCLLYSRSKEFPSWLQDDLKCSVIPKDQSWIFIGRTEVDAEAPILWPPDVKN